MPDGDIHTDVAAYALGRLDPGDAARFEQHLAGCAGCREELGELAPAARLLTLAGPADEPPSDLQARTFMAIEREAGSRVMAPASPAHRGRPRRRRALRLVLAGAAAAAVIVAVLAGVRLGEQRQPGTREVDTVLVTPAGARGGAAVVTAVGIGRIVTIESRALPVLDNDAEFYEAWFVAPGDTRADPDRVSAGTFHPDEQGRTDVRLAAAAVPADYPVLSVTREPRDGDPRATGREVLRSR